MNSTVHNLRLELRNILSTLNTQIRAENSTKLINMKQQLCASEVSLVYDFYRFATQCLTGTTSEDIDNAMSIGSVRDLQDTVSTEARDVKLQRDDVEMKCEASFENLSLEGKALLNKLIEAETAATQFIQEHETHLADRRSKALRVCVAEIGDHLTQTLGKAQKVTSVQELDHLANHALVLVCQIVVNWLAWNEKSEQSWQTTKCPQVVVSNLLASTAIKDANVAHALQCVRSAMKLRRQQHRIVGLSSRMIACIQACDALTSLQRSIITR